MHARADTFSSKATQTNNNNNNKSTKPFQSIAGLLSVMWALLKNPVFMFITLAGASEGIMITGFATFMPKIIQNQFGVSAGFASILGGKKVLLF
jgi:hypothetical protein